MPSFKETRTGPLVCVMCSKLCKILNFNHIDKWYMYRSHIHVLKNKTQIYQECSENRSPNTKGHEKKK